MKRTKCLSCGTQIQKSSTMDAYICRPCELDHGVEIERFDYLDTVRY